MNKRPLLSISNFANGAPDCWHVDCNGKSTPEIVCKHFGLPRKYRHDRNLLAFILDREARMRSFLGRLLHYRNLGAKVLLGGDDYVSPECHVFARFDEGWHLRRTVDFVEASKLPDEDREQMLTELRGIRQHPKWKNYFSKAQAIAIRDNITVDQAIEDMAWCGLESWLRAREALKNWYELNESERQLLAEAIFCGFTFLGKKALEEAQAIEPSILAYYDSFLGLPRSKAQAVAKGNAELHRHLHPDGPEVPMQASSSSLSACPSSERNTYSHAPGDHPANSPQASSADVSSPARRELNAPKSFQELYELIATISKQALEDKVPSHEPALRIRALLDRDLQHLIELNTRLPLDEILDLIERYCAAVLQMTDALEFRDSDQRDLVPVLNAAWKLAVVSALKEGASQAWFELNLTERRELPNFVERYAAENQKIALAGDEIEILRAQITEAKYTARTALKASESRKLSEITSAQGELDNLRVEAAHYLVPEGRTLDDLMDDTSLHHDIAIDADHLDPVAVKVLKAVVQILAGQQGEAPTATITTVGHAFPLPANSVHTSAEPTGEAESPPSAEPASHIGPSAAQLTTLTASEEPSVRDLTTPEVAAISLTIEAEAFMPPAPVRLVPEIAPTPPDDAHADVLVPLAAGGLDAALRHLQPSESPKEAQKAFRIAYGQFSQVPGNVIEAIALHWLDRGHINVAHQILRDATDTTLVTGRVLDAGLLRSAFYGMNMWPKDREALTYTQRALNLLNYKDLEEQLDRKPSGKLVPYVLVCATLQPALFAGRETLAPSLLRTAEDYFDGALKQLIGNVAQFTLRGGRVDLDALRDEAGQESHQAATRMQDQVRTWVELNAHRTTRWMPLRIALRLCINKPVIAEAIQAIQDGEKGDVAAVRLLVNTYSDHAHTRLLLDDLLDEVRAEYSNPHEQADGPAYAIFQQQIDSLVAISQEWLLEVAPSEMLQKEVSEFVRRFRTQLDRSIAQLIGHPRSIDLEHRAGSSLLQRALRLLQAEIKGEGPSLWRFDQADATFRLPEVLARLDIDEVETDLRLEWFAMRLTSPNWPRDMIELARRRDAHWVHLLLLRQLESMGEKHDTDIEGAISRIAGTRADLKKAVEQFKSLSIQAMSDDVALSADAIPEEEHLANMLQASEWLEKLDQYKPFVDVTPVADEVKRLTRALDNQLKTMAHSLEDELNQGLFNLRTHLGADAVPESWESKARSALERRNLTVVRELVNQLQDHLNRNAVLTAQNHQENIDLANFQTVEGSLYALLDAHSNPREAGGRIIEKRPGDFDYSRERANFKGTLEKLLEWGSRGPNKKPNMEKLTYESIVQILDFVGFEPVEKTGTADVIRQCEYSTTGDFRRLKVRIERPTLPKGFPLFEGDYFQAVALNVIFVQGTWSMNGLVDLVERHGLPAKGVLLVGSPLSPDERRAFSGFCHERKCSIFLIDPVLLSYLAALPMHQVLKAMLHVTSAWTFYNPYTKGDTRQPAPPEMRFGREHDVSSLVEPRGAALVYGGRQLGKTTLLHSAVQNFRQMDPSRNYAFYLRMDGLFQHAVERGIDVKTRVLEQLVSKLSEANLLPASSAGKKAEERLQAEFQRTGQSRVLFCLDEIDSVLDRDARTNFQLVRSLAALVNDPNQRFRLVLAGLNNVNRFRTMPNVPLEQLGSPLQVKILPAVDARSLILHPLTALGYRFEDEGLVDRIMAFTNCHPSLLHIFCSELVEQMALDRSVKGGSRLIRQSDIDKVETNSDVRRLSGDRFDMTLNLDRRYTVAIYGLIKHYGKSIGKFTAKQARDVARDLVPEEFEQMSEAGFENLLEELVGLGVLRVTDKSLHQYAMRNQSILQLVGSPNAIVHKLQVAVQDLANHAEDVLTCHVANTSQLPSPLSLQDERQILQAKSPDGAPKYSVTVVMGSLALGLSTKWIQEGFEAINEFRSGNVRPCYETKPIDEAQVFEPKRFREQLRTAINKWAMERPTVLLASLPGDQSIDRILDLLSIANESASQATLLKHELRVVFLLGPRAMWNWHAHPWLTSSPDEIGGLVELNRWTRHACESLLDQQGLDVTPEQARMLHAATEGWYPSMLKFIEVRKKKEKDRVSSFNDFAKDFPPVADLTPKDFSKFVEFTGMGTLEWSMPLAAKLRMFDSLDEFSVEDLQTAIEFLDDTHQSHISPEQASYVVRWWTGLRVIEANTKETSKKAGKGDRVTYRFTPAIKRAIEESTSAAGTTNEVMV